MMRNLYIICTVLSTIWTLGDYNTVHFVTGGGPGAQTHVLATLGIRNAFELGDPPLGMATVITALPLLDPAGHLPDAQAAKPRRECSCERRARSPAASPAVAQALGIVLGPVLILFWTLLPIYNMVLISLEPTGRDLQPATLSAASRRSTASARSSPRASATSRISGARSGTACSSASAGACSPSRSPPWPASRSRGSGSGCGWLLSNAALAHLRHPDHLPRHPVLQDHARLRPADNLWSVILVEVTFATPYAIFIFQQYSASIPHELDEAARIDGASTPQIFFHIFVPLMRPALVAVGTYALLLAWNEYLYAFLLLSSDAPRHPAGGARLLPQQRRGALERDDGDRPHLLAAAADDLLLLPQPHERRA